MYYVTGIYLGGVVPTTNEVTLTKRLYRAATKSPGGEPGGDGEGRHRASATALSSKRSESPLESSGTRGGQGAEGPRGGGG